jgi:hypothetical protein
MSSGGCTNRISIKPPRRGRCDVVKGLVRCPVGWIVDAIRRHIVVCTRLKVREVTRCLRTGDGTIRAVTEVGHYPRVRNADSGLIYKLVENHLSYNFASFPDLSPINTLEGVDWRDVVEVVRDLVVDVDIAFPSGLIGNCRVAWEVAKHSRRCVEVNTVDGIGSDNRPGLPGYGDDTR